MTAPKAEILIEASWEVCNKVGGINTVIRSKTAQIVKYYKNHNYFLIGPYFADKVAGEFEESLPQDNLKKIADELKEEGIILHFGKWQIKGDPNVILIDFQNYMWKANDIKKELWDTFQVDSLSGGSDYTDPLVWSYASGKLIEKMQKILNKKIVAQFHEWLSGAGLLYLKKNNVPVATVFTTHATVMGRTLASAGIDLYCDQEKGKCTLQLMDMDKEAYNYHTQAKHLIEKKSAEHTDIFTTVSEITGLEAEYVLKRKPDVILPNGLDMEKFPTFEEASVEHRFHRDQIREFMLYTFFPYYQFDIKNTLIFFLAGRYEFRDKGIDIYIKSLAKLNEKMKKAKSKKTILAFIWVPSAIRSIKPELLENKTLFNDIKDGLAESLPKIKKNILYSILARKELSELNIFGKDFLSNTKRKLAKIKKKGSPPLSTHDLNDQNDIIMQSLFEAGLDNQEDDRVKVMLYPIYLTGADGLLDLSYYEAMAGGHLGVFPSFYEPWGYTPLEAAALGVSSVTTDLAGFGKFILEQKQDKDKPGIFVLKRMGKTDEEINNDLSNFMYKFIKLSKHDRVLNKIEAKHLASLADWKNLIKNYIIAQNKAYDKLK